MSEPKSKNTSTNESMENRKESSKKNIFESVVEQTIKDNEQEKTHEEKESKETKIEDTIIDSKDYEEAISKESSKPLFDGIFARILELKSILAEEESITEDEEKEVKAESKLSDEPSSMVDKIEPSVKEEIKIEQQTVQEDSASLDDDVKSDVSLENNRITTPEYKTKDEPELNYGKNLLTSPLENHLNDYILERAPFIFEESKEKRKIADSEYIGNKKIIHSLENNLLSNSNNYRMRVENQNLSIKENSFPIWLLKNYHKYEYDDNTSTIYNELKALSQTSFEDLEPLRLEAAKRRFIENFNNDIYLKNSSFGITANRLDMYPVLVYKGERVPYKYLIDIGDNINTNFPNDVLLQSKIDVIKGMDVTLDKMSRAINLYTTDYRFIKDKKDLTGLIRMDKIFNIVLMYSILMGIFIAHMFFDTDIRAKHLAAHPYMFDFKAVALSMYILLPITYLCVALLNRLKLRSLKRYNKAIESLRENCNKIVKLRKEIINDKIKITKADLKHHDVDTYKVDADLLIKDINISASECMKYRMNKLIDYSAIKLRTRIYTLISSFLISYSMNLVLVPMSYDRKMTNLALGILAVCSLISAVACIPLLIPKKKHPNLSLIVYLFYLLATESATYGLCILFIKFFGN